MCSSIHVIVKVTFSHTYVRTSSTDIRTCIHVHFIHTFIHTYIHSYMHTYIQYKKYIHTCICTHIHTYIHTYIQYIQAYVCISNLVYVAHVEQG